MTFSSVVGQQSVKQRLIKLTASHHIPHALLFIGKEGVGGLPLAWAFAQYIFCEQKLENDACGHCTSCIKVSKLVHPDLHLTYPAIAPKPGVKPLSRLFLESFRTFMHQSPYGNVFDWLQYIEAENKQGNIPAEECREIIERLQLKSYEGGYKIQIIWMPEFLGKEGNILLKLIEEPPAKTLIFLVAENTDEILATILSRVQQVQLPPIAIADIAQHLVDSNQASTEKAKQIAQLSEGSYTNALELLRHTDADLLPPLIEWMQALTANNGVAIHQWVEEMASLGREKQKNILIYLLHLINQCLRASVSGFDASVLLESEAQFVKLLLHAKVAPQSYQLFTESITKAIYHIERNAHSKTQLMHLSIQMQYHFKGRKLKL